MAQAERDAAQVEAFNALPKEMPRERLVPSLKYEASATCAAALKLHGVTGGVMLRPCLFPKVRANTQALLNGYIQAPQLLTADGIAAYVCPSKWGNAAGMVGALTLAQKALKDSQAAGPKANTTILAIAIGVAAVVAFGAIRAR